jgi:GrpB-like predicted nucleotidyltransferase (UPF0157 family)
MSKKLEEMSLQELWELFPIILVKHQDYWSSWCRDEIENLKSILPDTMINRISHIGSTSIPDIWAKPIIDILLEINRKEELCLAKEYLLKNGWLCMDETEDRISLNKGYTDEGYAEKVFHLHLRVAGDHDELYFRDYLLKFPDIAKEYEELKLSLWKRYEHDRDGYTKAKTDFVKKYTELSKIEFGNKYSVRSNSKEQK